MVYIGNTAGNRFVTSTPASVYSGDGSTTVFTLEHSVGSDEDILVSVDGVVQEPSVAYAVSNGTTLTFTGAPSNNAGNNIFVYYLHRTVASVNHSEFTPLKATTGTFSGNVSVGGNLDVTGSLDMSDANLTNVGSIQLDSISGDADTDTNITFSGSDVITFTTGGSTAFTANANQSVTFSGSVTGITDLTMSGNLTVDTNTLYVDAANNRVGVGTASPSSKLQILGGTSGLDQLSLSSNLTNNTIKYAGVIMTNYANTTTALLGGKAENGTTSIFYGSSGTDHRGPQNHIFYTNSSSTATSGNTERMRIDSSGNVGIGTASPNRVLTVQSSVGTVAHFDSTGTIGGGISLGDANTTSNYVRVRGVGDDLQFTSGNAERMRIDSSGNLLVGQTTNGITSTGIGFVPNGVSHLYTVGERALELGRGSNDGEILRFNRSGTTVGSIGVLNSNNLTISSHTADHAGIQFGTHSITPMEANADADGTIDIGSINSKWKDLYLSNSVRLDGATRDFSIQQDNYGLRVYDNDASSERFRIDAAGNVGIGISSPERPFHVFSSGIVQAFIETSGSSARLAFESSGSNTNAGNLIAVDANDMWIRTNNTERMRIRSTGKIGLGTSNADAELHIEPVSGGANASILLSNDGRTQYFRIQNNETDDALTFNANDTSERMRINSSGDLLVGKTSVGIGNLGIEIRNNNLFAATRANEPSIYGNRTGSDGAVIEIRQDNAATGDIGTRGGDIYMATADTGIRAYDAQDAILPVGVDGASRDAAVNLGIGSIRFNNLYLSGGVYLGGTGSANLLDDYEEGTWTPSLNGYSGTPTFSNAVYVKSGNLVLVAVRVELDGTSDASRFEVAGLPFTVTNTTNSVFGGGVSYTNSSFSRNIYILVNSNGTKFGLYEEGASNLTYTEVGVNKEIRFFVIYRSQ